MNCINCKYSYYPESISDYEKKTYHLPHHLCDWGREERKQFFYLCSNPEVAEIDHVNETTIYSPCYLHNFNGECHYYREENAIDIIPSTIEIDIEKIVEDTPSTQSDEDTEDTPTEDTSTEDTPSTPNEDTTPTEEEVHYYIDDKVKISVTVTPFSTPAVTEDITEEVQVPKLDIDDTPMADEEGNQIYETQTVTRTETIEPAFTNDQDIKYKYQWFKNNRKLWKETASELLITLKELGTDKYFCVVTQSLTDNHDGGDKLYSSPTEVVEIEIEEKPEEPSDTPSDDTPTEPSDNSSEPSNNEADGD